MATATVDAQGAPTGSPDGAPARTYYELPSEYHRRMILTMCERMEKQIAAAKNTVGAIDESAPHSLDKAQRSVDDLRRIFSVQLDAVVGGAPGVPAMGRGGHVEQTPIEREIAARDAGTGTLGAVDTNGPDIAGVQWADYVPTPRPTPADFVTFPSRSRVAIRSAVSYDEERNAFGVRIDDGSAAGAPLTVYRDPRAGEWRVFDDVAEYDDDAAPGVPDGASSGDAAGSSSAAETDADGTADDVTTDPDLIDGGAADASAGDEDEDGDGDGNPPAPITRVAKGARGTGKGARPVGKSAGKSAAKWAAKSAGKGKGKR